MKNILLSLILILFFSTLTSAQTGLTDNQRFVYTDFIYWLSDEDNNKDTSYSFDWWQGLTDQEEIPQIIRYAGTDMKAKYQAIVDKANADIKKIEQACIDWGSSC